jgi:hypothetical protein
MTVAYPTTDLDIEVKLDVTGDGVFDTDITPYVMVRDSDGGIEITRGRTAEAGLVDPGSCRFQLNNRDGRFSPRNAEGPYFGQIGRNTPVQVAVKGGDTYLHTLNTASQGASTPDSAALSITGDIDIRFDATLNNWFAAGGFNGTAELCGKGDFSAGNRAWILMVRNDLLHFEWSADGTTTISVDSTEKPLVPLSRRLAVRVTLDVNNGASGNTVTFYTASSISGTWTQLGQPVVTAGTTSIKDEAKAVNVGRGWPLLAFDSAVGHIHAFELRSGIGGSVVASPDFTVQTDGATSFADAQGNTWTRAAYPDSNITDLDVRFTGEMVAWPNRWDTTGNDVWVQVAAKGTLRRLDAGNATLESALRRRIPTFSPVAYWPMEDGENSVQFYSPIETVRPLSQSGFDLASESTLGGSKPLPTIRTGAQFYGRVPSTNTGQFRVDMVYEWPTAPASNATLIRILTTGSVQSWSIRMRTGNLMNILAVTSDGTSIIDFDIAWGNALFGEWNHIALKASQSGGNVAWSVTVYKDTNTSQTYSDTYAGSVGRVTGVTGGQPTYGSGADGLTIGHIAAFDDQTVDAFGLATWGYDGESAGARVDRIATEEGESVIIHGWQSETELMGPQGPSTFLNLLRDAADADEGILCESRDTAALKFVGLASITNQEPTVTLTYPTHIQPGIQPEPDDLLLENDVSVTRSSGSTGRITVTEGTLSSSAPPDGVGRYEASYTLDIYDDERTDDHAGWKAHLGTVDEERYTAIPVSVGADPSLFGVVSLLDVATILKIDNQQTGDKLPPGDITLFINGYDEFLNQRRWEFSFNGSPYSPYQVGVLDDTTLGRMDTEGSQLNSSATSTATSISVATTSGPIWTTAAGDAPFDIIVAGEVMTVTAVSGSSSPQTFTVTRSVNGVVKAQSSGADVRLAQPTIIALN